jgi:hypothetical protein
MSLQAFQRAVVELTLSYQAVRALRDDDASWLASYDLTRLEQDRLRAIVRQPGIAVHCTLSRGNRLEVVVNAFPMTCILLESRLRTLVDELWEHHHPTNYQLAGEEIAFAAFIGKKITASQLAVEYLPEVLAYEMLCVHLTNRSWVEADTDAGVEGTLVFDHSPDDLLPPLARLMLPPAGLPTGSFPSRVTLRNKRFEVDARFSGSDARA